MGVISNADGRMEDALEGRGLRGTVEFVIDSEVVGVEKPDSRIFEAGARLGPTAEACVYVGDLYPVDYVGAQSGWPAGRPSGSARAPHRMGRYRGRSRRAARSGSPGVRESTLLGGSSRFGRFGHKMKRLPD